MKNTFGILLAAIGFTFYSCSEDSVINEDLNSPLATEMVSNDVSFEATATALYEDIDEAADFGMESIVSSSGRPGGGDKGGKKGGQKFGDCAVVTEDEATGTKTIDFGDGCEGRDGRVRSGQIVIEFSGEKKEVGSVRTTTLVDFAIDTIQIEGVRTATFVSSTDTEMVYTQTLTGGKMTFPDGLVATRESSKTRVAYFDEEGEKSGAIKFGNSSGINKENLAYSNVIEESTPLTFSSECREEKVFAPVSGISTSSLEGESDKVIDYGDGTCDNLATVTQDGVTEEIEIDGKQRRKKRK